MKLHGEVEILLRDAVSEEVQQRIVVPNLIPDNTLVTFANSFYHGNNLFAYAKISISTSTTDPARTSSTVTNIIATGAVPTGVSSPTWVETATPQYGQIQNRIDATGSDRAFRTVALTELTSANVQNNLSATAFAYLLLDTPCVQGANQVLDIFYRVQWLNLLGQNLSEYGLIEQGRAAFACTASNSANTNTNNYYLVGHAWSSFAACPNSTYTYPYRYLNSVDFLSQYTNDSAQYLWTVNTAVPSHYKRRYRRDWSTSDWVGRILQTILHGSSYRDTYTFYSWSAPASWRQTPFQTAFGHKSTSTLPFLDSLHLATGTGTFTLAGTWTGGWPQMFKLMIVQGGAVGTATYKWSVRSHLGFEGNTYTNRIEPNIYRNPNRAAAPGMHGWQDTSKHLLRFSPTQMVQYDSTGITLLDLVSGVYQNWDATTTPALGATNIGQVAVGSGSIWVGCRSTGLYQIDVSTNTVTLSTSTQCYGVDVGRSNRVYALLEGRLANSDNWATALTFTSTGISDSNWSTVRYLKCDPTHADDRLLLMNPSRMTWWNQATGTAVNGSTSVSSYQAPNSLACSTTGFWVARADTSLSRLTYGSTSINGIFPGGNSFVYGPVNVQFNEQGYSVEPYSAGAGCVLIKPDLTIAYSGSAFDAGTAFVYMGNGIGAGSRMRCLFGNDSTYAWTSYGWNGSAWVIDHAGAKTTHSDDQSLGQGLTVRWADGDGAPYFAANDFYTQGVCNGLWKDNATTATYGYNYYYKPAQFDVPIPVGVTVPATAPYTVPLPVAPSGSSPDLEWVRAETDEPLTQQFKLNGTAIATLYVNNETPGPNEITLNGVTGVLTFNAADAGKTLSGTYCYIKH